MDALINKIDNHQGKPYYILKAKKLPNDFGKIGDYNFIDTLLLKDKRIFLPENESIRPHSTTIKWHRENIFCP